jgi:hypothetical protein
MGKLSLSTTGTPDPPSSGYNLTFLSPPSLTLYFTTTSFCPRKLTESIPRGWETHMEGKQVKRKAWDRKGEHFPLQLSGCYSKKVPSNLVSTYFTSLTPFCPSTALLQISQPSNNSSLLLPPLTHKQYHHHTSGGTLGTTTGHTGGTRGRH